MVHRSPFCIHSVAEVCRLRLFSRVMIRFAHRCLVAVGEPQHRADVGRAGDVRGLPVQLAGQVTGGARA
jgi:hypothetical protein